MIGEKQAKIFKIYFFRARTHAHTKMRSLHVSKAPPNYELLPTIIITMRGPRLHKSTHNQSQALPHSHHCPTLHSHTHAQWALQSQGSHYATPSHKDTHQSSSHQRGKRMTGMENWRKTGETQKLEPRLCGECAGNVFGRYYCISVSPYHQRLINH